MRIHLSGATPAPTISAAAMPGHYLAQVGHMMLCERNAVAVVGLVMLDALKKGHLHIHDSLLENAIYSFQDALRSTVEVEAVTGAALAVSACLTGGAA